ncbi:MAG: hypothetical protein LC664_06960 [Flavobacteriales bacterium]|nr:hypothetical protein [Flavobacteriales bacterium]
MDILVVKKILGFLGFLWFSSNANCQYSDFFLKAESNVAVSVGNYQYESRTIVDGELSLTLPNQSRYNNPLLNLNVIFGKRISRFGIGVGVGTSILEMAHPFFADETYKRIYYPVELNVDFDFVLFKNLEMTTNGSLGYSFLDEKFLKQLNQYHWEFSGGLSGSLFFGIHSFEFLNWKFVPGIGYMYNEFKTTLNSGYFSRFRLSQEIDKVEYTTRFHSISFGLIISPD